MKIQDLGALDGPMLLFGGPYSNLQALMALQAQAAALAIAPEQMICTGDVVAYCGDPVACVDALRAAQIPVIAGNCEKQLAAGAPDCGCGFEEGTACDLLSVGWYGFANAQMGADHRHWMANLPDVITFRHAGKRFGVIHGGVTDIARFVWSSSDRSVFDAEWLALEQVIGPVDAIVSGHSGIPFQHATARGPWINAGVIGMPPNDGAPLTHFAILDRGSVTFHPLAYDVDAAVTAMTHAGLTQGYHRALKTGYWPSEDILPPALRRATPAKG